MRESGGSIRGTQEAHLHELPQPAVSRGCGFALRWNEVHGIRKHEAADRALRRRVVGTARSPDPFRHHRLCQGWKFYFYYGMAHTCSQSQSFVRITWLQDF